MYQKTFAVLFKLSLPFFILLAIFFPTPAVDSAEQSQAQVYFLQALKTRDEGRFDVAERLMRQAVQLEPNNADYHFELGNIYILMKNLESARRELEQTIMIAPHHIAGNYNLGLVYKELRLMGVAREQFRRVLQIDPENARAMLQIGYIYAEQGFYEDARDAFEAAYVMDASNPEAEDALEQLKEIEVQAKENEDSQMHRSLMGGQQLLGGLRNNSPQSSQFALGGSQPSGSSQDALTQAGMLLIQQMLSRRGKDSSQ